MHVNIKRMGFGERRFLVTEYKYEYLHDERPLPMVQFFVTQSPVLKANVSTGLSLPGVPSVPESLVEIQVVLPIL